MQIWVWLGAYLAGFVLLQLYLYRQFISGSESSTTAGVSKRTALDTQREQDTPGALGYGDSEGSSDTAPPGNLTTEEAIRCDDCGAYNEGDQMFVYCRDCGAEL
jgi:hypothetical protein